MICDSPAGMGGRLWPLRGPCAVHPRRPLFVATLRSVPSAPCTFASNLPAVIGPVQQSLALTRSAQGIAWLAVSFDLVDVPSDRLPALDLARVFDRHASAHAK